MTARRKACIGWDEAGPQDFSEAHQLFGPSRLTESFGAGGDANMPRGLNVMSTSPLLITSEASCEVNRKVVAGLQGRACLTTDKMHSCEVVEKVLIPLHCTAAQAEQSSPSQSLKTCCMPYHNLA